MEIALPGRAQMTYLGRKRLYGRLRGYRETIQINEKINFIQDSFQRFFQHCKSTSHWLLLEVYILYHIKMHISEYVCKTFLKELAFFLKCRVILWNNIAACNVSKIAAIQQLFFYHFLRTVPKKFQSLAKFFQSISTSHSEPFKFTRAFNR